MNLDNIFNLFNDETGQYNDDTSLLVDFSDHPLFWISGFNKVIDNHLFFQKYTVKTFKNIAPDINVDELEKAGEELMFRKAWDYIKPFDVEKAIELIHRAVEQGLRGDAGAKELAAWRQDSSEIIGQAPAMQELFRAIGRLARSHITVLINGESGTGKELIARAIHNISNRSKKPLVKVNCATLPANLIESELFGHRAGSFTGAVKDKKGLLEEANGGTVFLDEIGEMNTDLQAKSLSRCPCIL